MDTGNLVCRTKKKMSLKEVFLTLFIKHYRCYFPLFCPSSSSEINILPSTGFKKSRPCLLNEKEECLMYFIKIKICSGKSIIPSTLLTISQESRNIQSTSFFAVTTQIMFILQNLVPENVLTKKKITELV